MMSGSHRSAAVARARRLGRAFDLLGAYEPIAGVFFERSGLGVAGTRAGERVPVGDGSDGESPGRLASAVLNRLRAIRHDGDGPAPAGVGGLPFGPPALGELVVPRRAVVRTMPDATWSVDVGPGAELDRAVPSAAVGRAVDRRAPHDAFTNVQLEPVPPPHIYAAAVRESVRSIRLGELRKVVLARTIEVSSGHSFDARRLAHRLRAVDPDAYTFAVPVPGGALIGASPELLVSRQGNEIRSNPLEGSAPRSGDPVEDRANADALVRSAKDRDEHVVVVEAIAETLGPYCQELAWDQEPVLLATANVWHLSTRFRGILRDPPASAMELVLALHPTPAVAGAPLTAALEIIASLEPFDRGAYAGPVGWVDADGDGVWAIALRCAELRHDRATLYAGAGIVADSDPDREVDETERKFRAFLDALRWS